MEARLIACNIPTTDHTKSNAFYQALTGIEPARSLSDQMKAYHLPISNDEQYLWLSDRTVPQEQPACVFAVDNLDQAITTLVNAGGQQMGGVITATVDPADVDYFRTATKGRDPNAQPQPQMGRLGYVKDPDGNVLMLFEVSAGAGVWFGTGHHKKGLDQQVLQSHNKAIQRGKQKP